MFDTVYALARPGICVYSGHPQDLTTHLSQCNITCTESEFPIEVMLKLLSSDKPDEHLESLRNRTKEIQNYFTDNIGNQADLICSPMRLSLKSFKVFDFWVLLKRMAHCCYLCNWKSTSAQFILTQMTAFTLMLSYGDQKVYTGACLDSNTLTNDTCLMSATNLKEQANIDQTINYHFSILNFVMFFQLVVTTLTFSSDFQLFLKEHRNGINIFYHGISTMRKESI